MAAVKKGTRLEYRNTLRMLRAVKRQIREVLGPDDEDLSAYYRAYKEELVHCRASRTSLDLFLAEARRSPVLLMGDFHTLPHAQKFFVHILDELGKRRIRPIVVLEMVQARHDALLQRYFKGRLTRDEFLDKTAYFENWGFDFQHYRPIFDYAKTWRLTVHGLNREGALAARDRFMALRLKHLHLQYTDQPLLVLVGDLHLAAEHLPRELEREGLHPAILFQNSETVYLKKLKSGQDPVGWWRLGPGRFLNNNTAPQVKMQTYLTWTEHGGEALYQAYGYTGQREENGEIELSDGVTRLARALTDLFGLHRDPPTDFQVFEGNSLLFLEDQYFESGAGRCYARLIRDARSLFILRGRIIYVPQLDLNRTVEETLHLLMDQWLPTARGLAAFLSRAHYFASGFLGSKLVNPTRPGRTPQDFRRFLEDFRAMPDGKVKVKLSHEAKAAEQALHFLDLLKSDRPVRRGDLASVLRTDFELLFDVSRFVGYSLGEKLHELHDAGQLAASDLKRYVFDQDDPFYLLGWRIRVVR